jgi:hypothetical protein
LLPGKKAGRGFAAAAAGKKAGRGFAAAAAAGKEAGRGFGAVAAGEEGWTGVGVVQRGAMLFELIWKKVGKFRNRDVWVGVRWVFSAGLVRGLGGFG